MYCLPEHTQIASFSLTVLLTPEDVGLWGRVNLCLSLADFRLVLMIKVRQGFCLFTIFSVLLIVHSGADHWHEAEDITS